ncbi:MAG: hypothetical protein IKF64_07520 [Eubacterium sp.]|nr:hypothetical protein [Eubacterium sp.]
MQKKKSKLKNAQEEAQVAINKTNEKIDELGKSTKNLYLQLTAIQEIFDKIRNIPSDKKLQYEELKQVRLNWKEQAEKIENDYKEASIKNVGAGATGAGIGVAIVTLGPTAAMGVATTFGVASTGTAISALSGAAATNAALAWLGGGALVAGGGGMAAGEAVLALAGPVGWAIAGAALLTSGLLFIKNHNDKKHIESIFTLISKRDISSYELAIVELNERIARIIDETKKLIEAIDDIMTFGQDYVLMSERQQYSLGAYVNLMLSSTQLLVNPILGLQPKFTVDDYICALCYEGDEEIERADTEEQRLVVFLANLLYKIDLSEKDKHLLWKALRKNKKMLKALNVSKKTFNKDAFDEVFEALNYKYSLENEEM